MNDDKLKPAGSGGMTTPFPMEKATAGTQPKADDDDRDERKPEDLTDEELRLMADTMPGEGPGDD
jgi:hypothetical protein